LLIKASQIKDVSMDLWQGFRQREKKDGSYSYHPKELIMPYDFNLFDKDGRAGGKHHCSHD
tara:strand:+ start:714 stop:896 length:183 start_codon:yes stop_codon:yes gene_type:complete